MRSVRLCASRKAVRVTSAVDRSISSCGVVSLTCFIGSLDYVLSIQGRVIRLRKSVGLSI